jgi:phosphatidylglycerol:prolipoprotein diacylglycerol transferase
LISVYPRLFQFGHIAIPSYGVFTALAILAALTIALHTARRLAIDPNKIWNLGLIAIFSVLLGSRLLLIVIHLRDFLAHPFWMLGLVSIRSNGVFYAGVLLAIGICFGYISAVRLPLLRTLDCLTPALALGLAIESLGAFAAGSEYGSPTTLPWGIVYRHGLAALWSGAPLGIRVHPVQLYEGAAALALFVLQWILLPRRSQDGELAGIFLFGLGIAFYFLDLYRGERTFVFAGAISLMQLIGIVCVLAGAALWLRRTREEIESGR